MIMAEIGNSLYKLGKLDDADALLHILSRADLLDESWELPFTERQYFSARSGERIKIIITQNEPLTYEEAQALIAKARSAKDAIKKIKNEPDALTV